MNITAGKSLHLDSCWKADQIKKIDFWSPAKKVVFWEWWFCEFAVAAGGVAGCAPLVSHSVLRMLIEFSVGWRLSREWVRKRDWERAAPSAAPWVAPPRPSWASGCSPNRCAPPPSTRRTSRYFSSNFFFSLQHLILRFGVFAVNTGSRERFGGLNLEQVLFPSLNLFNHLSPSLM